MITRTIETPEGYTADCWLLIGTEPASFRPDLGPGMIDLTAYMRCWKNAVAAQAGKKPVATEAVALLGVAIADVDSPEKIEALVQAKWDEDAEAALLAAQEAEAAAQNPPAPEPEPEA